MVVKATKQQKCECGEVITLREYVGMEGGWYSDHHCNAHMETLIREDRRERIKAVLR